MSTSNLVVEGSPARPSEEDPLGRAAQRRRTSGVGLEGASPSPGEDEEDFLRGRRRATSVTRAELHRRRASDESVYDSSECASLDGPGRRPSVDAAALAAFEDRPRRGSRRGSDHSLAGPGRHDAAATGPRALADASGRRGSDGSWDSAASDRPSSPLPVSACASRKESLRHEFEDEPGCDALAEETDGDGAEADPRRRSSRSLPDAALLQKVQRFLDANPIEGLPPPEAAPPSPPREGDHAEPGGRRRPMDFSRTEFRRRSSGNVALDAGPDLDLEEDRIGDALDAALGGRPSGSATAPYPDGGVVAARTPAPNAQRASRDTEAPPEDPPAVAEERPPASGTVANPPKTHLPELAQLASAQPERSGRGSLLQRIFRRSIS